MRARRDVRPPSSSTGTRSTYATTTSTSTSRQPLPPGSRRDTGRYRFTPCAVAEAWTTVTADGRGRWTCNSPTTRSTPPGRTSGTAEFAERLPALHARRGLRSRRDVVGELGFRSTGRMRGRRTPGTRSSSPTSGHAGCGARLSTLSVTVDTAGHARVNVRVSPSNMWPMTCVRN